MSTQPTAPCRFPDLTPLTNPRPNTTITRRNISSARVPFSRSDALLPSLTCSPPSCSILLTAFAVFLRCYTGQDTITTLINTSEAAPTVAKITLNESSSVVETVGAKHLLPGEVMKPVDCDTAVILWDYRKRTKPSVVCPQPHVEDGYLSKSRNGIANTLSSIKSNSIKDSAFW